THRGRRLHGRRRPRAHRDPRSSARPVSARRDRRHAPGLRRSSDNEADRAGVGRAPADDEGGGLGPETGKTPWRGEGAFPYSDSAKREYRSVSYVAGALGKSRLVPPFADSSLPGVVARFWGDLGLAPAPGGLGPGHDFAEGQAGATGGPGGVVVLD